jgi:hypothetical protein
VKDFSKYVGLDVHKETIAVAVADGNGSEVRYVGEIVHTPEAVEKLVRQLRKNSASLSFCYEAGRCGYGLHRQLTDLGWGCLVVAPSLIPKKAGDRVKMDQRDSMSLARLHRAGELTAVVVPDSLQEALRDLTRAREDMTLPRFHVQHVMQPGAFPQLGRESGIQSRSEVDADCIVRMPIASYWTNLACKHPCRAKEIASITHRWKASGAA